ncbi:MAG: sulfatase [Planctomycetaceae bacterium]
MLPHFASLVQSLSAVASCLLFLPLTVNASIETTSNTPSSRPNIIVILADDMGYSDLSCYGNDRYTTPHLDRLAAEGMKFTDFHSNGAVCSPTRAAFMTGRYQQRCGIDEVITADPAAGKRDRLGLPDHEITLPEALRESGYRTGMCGKWHLGYTAQFNPTKHGFNTFNGYVSGNVDFHTHIDQAGFEDWWHNTELHPEAGYSTHLITNHAIEFIEENAGGEKPFFLYVAHEAPHYPYQGPSDPPVRGPGAQEPLKEKAEIQRAYREMVQEMDKGVGQILTALEAKKITQNTIVFFFSDNGGTREANNGLLRGFKGSLWEGGHRVPAIARWPGTIKAGATTSQTAIGMDLMPTFLELAGAKTNEERKLDGSSLASLLTRQTPLAERTLFWQFNQSMAVRRGSWKLIKNAPFLSRIRQEKAANEPTVALFNLEDSIGESVDLATTMPDIVEDLQTQLEAWQQDVRASHTTSAE